MTNVHHIFVYNKKYWKPSKYPSIRDSPKMAYCVATKRMKQLFVCDLK